MYRSSLWSILKMEILISIKFDGQVWNLFHCRDKFEL